jgi:hypothetical protein
MARKTEYGKYILSAGEIGAYTVCPEAWRLSAIEKVDTLKDKSVVLGIDMHKRWAKTYDEAVYFAREVKLLVLLVGLAIVLHLLR